MKLTYSAKTDKWVDRHGNVVPEPKPSHEGGPAYAPPWKPLHSEAMGVHPSQRKEAEQNAYDKGVPTEFDHTGCPIFRDRIHRTRFCKAYRMVDLDAGYSDAQ